MNRIATRFALFAGILLAAGVAHAQVPVQITPATAVLDLAPDGTGTLRLNLTIEAPYHIYSTLEQLSPKGLGPNPTTVAVKTKELVTLAGAPKTSAAKKHYDQNFEMDVLTLEGSAWIDVPLKAAASLTPGKHDGVLVVTYQACDEQSCLPPDDVEVKFTVDSAPGRIATDDDPRWAEATQLATTVNSPGTGATREERDQVRERQMQRLAALAWELYAAHPQDPRRWTAFEVIARGTLRFPGDEAAARKWAACLAQVEAAAETANDAPKSFRELIAAGKVSALVLPYTNTTLPPDWSARLVPPIEELAAKFPDGRSAFVYFSRLVSAVESQAPAALPTLVERMAASPAVHVRELAAQRRTVLQAMQRPLDFKFTALDGREVDTAKWRGKVVLVDFWATWCVPCIEAMPHLKELYAKYHDRGLEIVNISVDNANARPALEKLVAKLELPWPQFFDGRATQTDYAVRYGVQPIPHVLVAGPDGLIVAVNPPGEKLEAEIRRLLRL